jgi:serine O-acetyltransferase
LLRRPLSPLYKSLYKFIRIITGIELPCEVPIGTGFVIEHSGGIVISGFASFCAHCRIRNGMVIGLNSLGANGGCKGQRLATPSIKVTRTESI